MKIIQVQTQAEAAGAQRVSDMVGEGLRRRGHDVRTVFMYRKTAAYDADPFADFILRAPPGPIGRLRAALGLLVHLMRERPDAVLSYQHFGTVFGTIGGRLARARRLVANQSGVPLRGGARGIATALDRLMGALGVYHHSVVNSGWTAGQFDGYPAAYRKRLVRIDHGVEVPPRRYDRAWARAAFGLPAQVPLLVSTGRLSVLKNHALLLDVLALEPDWHLAIAGEGPERPSLLARAGELKVSDRLHLVGEVAPNRVHQFLAAGDAYGFPSLQETFGLAVVEAALAGLPVVASDLPVLREVLHTDAGEPAALFAEGGDAAAFREALRDVLGDAALAGRLAAAGRGLAARYAPERMIAAYEALLA